MKAFTLAIDNSVSTRRGMNRLFAVIEGLRNEGS